MGCRSRRCRENEAATNRAAARAATKAASQLTAARLDPLVVGVPGESARLWSHVTFGTGTCIGMIEGYLALGMPGDPLPGVTALRDRLNKIIATIEAQNAN